jgi:hypothetical protein
MINEAKAEILKRNNKRKNSKAKNTKTPEKLLIDEFEPILKNISSDEFQALLAFHADIMEHINSFNCRLQGKNQSIGEPIRSCGCILW